VKLTKYTAASLFFGLFLLTVFQCVQPPDYPNEPVITFKSLSRSILLQGTGTFDTTFATISFTDGDGDLGDSDSLNVFLIDKRDNFLKSKFRLPFIPEEGVGNGISGDITLRVNTSCCIFPNNVLPPCSPSTEFTKDTLRYIIYITDRAGNESNRVETSDIILLCK
jgi:hypothetical protein